VSIKKGLAVSLVSSMLAAGGNAAAQGTAAGRDDEPSKVEHGGNPIDGPPARVKGKKEIEPPPELPAPPIPPRAPHTAWVGWTFGTGYGYQGAGETETQAVTTTAGFAPGVLGYFGPEFGYQVNDRVAVSLQTRHQVIPKNTPDTTRTVNPNQWAHSVLARATYNFPFTHFQLYAGGVLGAGYFRFRTEPTPSMGVIASDTVHAGPGVVGPVAGITFPFAKAVSLVGEFRSLVGFPDFGVMGDFSLGLQFDIGAL
jgi:hypothetical protein